MTPEIIAQARDLLRQTDSAEIKELFSELNWQFHALIQRQAGMPLLYEMIESLSERIKRYSLLYYWAEPQRFMSNHVLELDLYKKGDIEGAKALHKRRLNISPLLSAHCCPNRSRTNPYSKRLRTGLFPYEAVFERQTNARSRRNGNRRCRNETNNRRMQKTPTRR